MTFFEVLIGVFVFLVLAGTTGLFLRGVSSAPTFLSESLNVQQELGRAIRTMSTEIRITSPSNTGSYPIAEAQDFSFTFYSDADRDGLKERIRYFLNGQTLQKGIIIPTGTPLAYPTSSEQISQVFKEVSTSTGAIFKYHDQSYDGSTTPLTQPVDVGLIRLVQITLTIDKNGNRSPAPLTVNDQIALRNLKNNL